MSHLKVAEKLFESGHLYDKVNGVFVNFKNAGTINIVELEKKRFPKSIDETFVYDFDEYLVFLTGSGPAEPKLPVTKEPKTYMKLGAETILKFPAPLDSVTCSINYRYSPDQSMEGHPWEVPIVVIESGSTLNKKQVFRRTNQGKTFEGYIEENGDFVDDEVPVDSAKFAVSGKFIFGVAMGADEIVVRLGGARIKHKTQTALKYHIEIEEPVFE